MSFSDDDVPPFTPSAPSSRPSRERLQWGETRDKKDEEIEDEKLIARVNEEDLSSEWKLEEFENITPQIGNLRTNCNCKEFGRIFN